MDRLIHDKGFLISWHHTKRSLNHPLLKIIENKISASEERHKIEKSLEPLKRYFPEHVNTAPIDTFLLDNSFYKPRDLVWRLSIAQKLFPNEKSFNDKVLTETEIDYSAKLWDEIRYELSANYKVIEIDAIEAALSGGAGRFESHEIEARFAKHASISPALLSLLKHKSVREVMSDLYRLGAIGNNFRAGPSGDQFRNRWAFRGDPSLLYDKRMEIHPALIKRLSAVAPRRRGPRHRHKHRE